jgi:hypothetical protein
VPLTRISDHLSPQHENGIRSDRLLDVDLFSIATVADTDVGLIASKDVVNAALHNGLGCRKVSVSEATIDPFGHVHGRRARNDKFQTQDRIDSILLHDGVCLMMASTSWWPLLHDGLYFMMASAS